MYYVQLIRTRNLAIFNLLYYFIQYIFQKLFSDNTVTVNIISLIVRCVKFLICLIALRRMF